MLVQKIADEGFEGFDPDDIITNKSEYSSETLCGDENYSTFSAQLKSQIQTRARIFEESTVQWAKKIFSLNRWGLNGFG